VAKLLRIRDLHLRFPTFRGTVHALNGVDLTLGAGQILGLVGETGSGKSMTAYATVGLVPPPGRITSGVIEWNGRNLLRATDAELQRLRGQEISMIFQSPRTSLNPLFSIAQQFEIYQRAHGQAKGAAARAQAHGMLERVGIPDPRRVLRSYPHELSTGMCQRILIAMALSGRPRLLLADEPTTGIDVTLQAQILRLVRELVASQNTATLLITHDLGVVAEICDRVAVMYAGRIVEEGPVERIYGDPRHPYTQGLIASTLRVDEQKPIHIIPGVVPNLLVPPSACMFRERCPIAAATCAQLEPPIVEVSLGQHARCHFAADTGAFAAAERQRAQLAGVRPQDLTV